jgi:hypothetical protein
LKEIWYISKCIRWFAFPIFQDPANYVFTHPNLFETASFTEDTIRNVKKQYKEESERVVLQQLDSVDEYLCLQMVCNSRGNKCF